MSEFEVPLARAARPRARRRPRRGTILTIGVAGVLMLAGAHDGGEGLRRAGNRVSVPLAEASAQREPVELPLDRVLTAAPEIVGPGPAPDLWSTPLRPADPPPAGTAAAEPETVEPAPVVTALRGVVPAALFEPASLVGGSAPVVELPDTPLRSSTDGTLPLDGLGAELAEEPAASVAAAPRVRDAAVPQARDAVPRVAGTWAANAAACGRRNSGFLPLVITDRGARAGSSSCAFGRKRHTGNGWAIAATCRSGAETWAANVKLIVEGRRLTWSSERGSETYTRCR